MRSSEGNLLSGPSFQLNCWDEHCRCSYDLAKTYARILLQVFLYYHLLTNWTIPLLFRTQKAARKGLKNNDSFGPDNIPTKTRGKTVTLSLHLAITSCWEIVGFRNISRIPTLLPLQKQKKQTELQQLSGYFHAENSWQGFLLPSTFQSAKIANKILPERPSGFRSARSIVDMMFF